MPDDLISLACQYGRCGECPERDEPAEAFDGSHWPIECACECHIDVDTPEARDWADEIRAHAVHGRST